MVMKATRVTGLALACAGFLAVGASGCSTRALNIYVPSRNVDILFVVDDSSKTAQLQRNLIMNFPILMQRLEDPPGFADLHLAVVSTDMGAGDGSIPGCDANGGKNGVFQYAPRGGCGASGLEPGATYISNIGGVKNYTDKIEDVIACIAPLGESGCGFEHPLAAAAARPGRRRPARPRRKPGLPAARSVSVRRGGDERRRLLGAAGIGPVRHQGEHVPRLDAGSADELSLQRVRPPLQRPEAAPQAAHRPRLRRRVAGRVRFGGARGHADPGGHDRKISSSGHSSHIRMSRFSSAPSRGRRRPTSFTGHRCGAAG